MAESVVVIKKLLQMQPAQHGEIIKHLAKLTDSIQVSSLQLRPWLGGCLGEGAESARALAWLSRTLPASGALPAPVPPPSSCPPLHAGQGGPSGPTLGFSVASPSGNLKGRFLEGLARRHQQSVWGQVGGCALGQEPSEAGAAQERSPYDLSPLSCPDTPV